ncbi:hypothetical protein DERF_003986 [Dermatophagoides farinae]|uniref:Uncharacterized protein n=1 Tax=Dermatophagoides farinae TaxID=6954 RepID=A0A922IFX2_DERFA|nr:hypothetical protein DERF_003986 [Dermatophagoides farinae]
MESQLDIISIHKLKIKAIFHLINSNAHNVRLRLNISQYGACSNKYITPAGNKVVYRRFGTFKLGYVLCSSTATSDMTSSLADAISPQMGCVKLQSIE